MFACKVDLRSFTEHKKRISFRISSVLSKAEPEPDLLTGSATLFARLSLPLWTTIFLNATNFLLKHLLIYLTLSFSFTEGQKMGDSHRQVVIPFLITTRDRGMDRPRQVVIPFLITTRDKTNKRQKHRVITPRGPKHICLFLAHNFLSWWGKCAWKIQKTGVVHFYIRVDRIFKGRGSSVHCTQCSFKNVNASVTLICFTIVSTQKLIFTNPVFPASLTRICPTMFKRVKRRRICFSSSRSYYSYGQKLRLLSA